MVRNITKLRKIILPLILLTMIISVLGYIQPDTTTTINSSNVTNETDPIAMANISSNYLDWSDEYNDVWINNTKLNKSSIEYYNGVLVAKKDNTVSPEGSFSFFFGTTYPVSMYSAGRWHNGTAWNGGRYINARGYALGFVGDTVAGNASTRGFRVQKFEPNSNSSTDFFQSHEQQTRVILGTFKVDNLSGTGNAYPITSDANGKIQVNRTAGAGITMKSPDGTVYCVTITNAGALTSTAGTCP